MRRPRMGGRRLVVLATTTALVTGGGIATAPFVFAAPAADPAAEGSWSVPFEEGGAGTPRCETVPNDGPNDERDRLQCKPTAVTSAMQPDGRVLYGNGIEAEENAEETVVPALSPEARDGRTRVLDLRDGKPTWTKPDNERTDGDNPNIQPGRTSDDCLTQDPLGVAGVPGRPGDGLVGSTNGALGGPQANPTCSPDDVQDNDGDIFCADIAQLPDGRNLLVGGTDWYNEPSILEKADGDPANVGVIELEGLRSARIFDGEKNRWDATGSMKYGRWYPTVTTMPDGKVTAVSGTTKLIKSTQGSQVRRTETYDPATGQWTEDYTGPNSEKTLPQNARMYLTPNGKLFYSGDGQMFGPFGQAADEALYAQQGFFNPETKEWENAGLTLPRSSPASVALPMKAPYDKMTILRAGGNFGPPPGTYVATPTTTLTSVDKEGKVTNEPGPLMNEGRWFSQPTPLPDGQTLLTNGARNDEVVFPGAELPVKTPELYNPDTKTFTQMALPERARTYHNNGLLLPNGQVLIGGNSPISLGYGIQRDAVPGITGNNDKDPSFELFSPPYLHKGDRPNIDGVQKGVAWGEDFDIATGNAGDISKVMLMRMPSPQHVMDSDTRTLELPFQKKDDGTLSASTPQDGVAAPPGYYYLFVNRTAQDGSSIPSVARIVHVGDQSDGGEALQPMGPETVDGFQPNGATQTEPNTILDNPPNPLQTPTVPGQTDPLGVPKGIPGVSGNVDDPNNTGIGQAPPNVNGDGSEPEQGPPGGSTSDDGRSSGSGQQPGLLPNLGGGASEGRRGHGRRKHPRSIS
ncbi:galactose oxidase early set domain-containing protein [Pseudonocardia endophytica]|uniref:Uncharacterized protein DUF1929 n=1 Tax=Pseudonocardia endophytica TaxID=401976 RepID=A0A4R1HZ18_PSEEN|nr:galactose oxidase early set domain-containing protein [Pseudonocardia endophytica]TCK26823.1 uncharacterized protein DUF1929 [Pseudonocardia endophytica]